MGRFIVIIYILASLNRPVKKRWRGFHTHKATGYLFLLAPCSLLLATPSLVRGAAIAVDGDWTKPRTTLYFLTVLPGVIIQPTASVVNNY